MEFLIALFFIWLFFGDHNNTTTSKSSTKSDNSNKKTINCPYCNKVVEVSDHGTYKCYDCNSLFGYHLGDRIAKEDDNITDAYIILAALFAKIAKSDGVVSETEIAEINGLMKHEFELNRVQRELFGLYFNSFKNETADYGKYILKFNKLATQSSSTEEFFVNMIPYFFFIASLDGGIHRDQIKILRYAVDSSYSVTNKGYDYYRNLNYNYTYRSNDYHDKQENSKKHEDTLEDILYRALECDSNVSDEVLRQSYRKLTQKYHPDKYQSKDLPDDMIEFATKRFIEIQQAYEEIQKIRKTS